MVTQQYTENFFTDRSVDITTFVGSTSLVALANNYTVNQSQTPPYVPQYDPIALNRNSYVDGLLLKTGLSQATIDQLVAQLTANQLLEPIAYGSGARLLPCFQARLHLLVALPLGSTLSTYPSCAL